MSSAEKFPSRDIIKNMKDAPDKAAKTCDDIEEWFYKTSTATK
jgi:hypothetical protein